MESLRPGFFSFGSNVPKLGVFGFYIFPPIFVQVLRSEGRVMGCLGQ